MIKNERQYRITKAQAEKFETALAQIIKQEDADIGISPLLKQAQREALQSQLEELQAEIRAYEALQAGQRQIIKSHSFDELPQALIQARIAVGFTHKELARRLGLKEQQIQRYEATEYASASFERIKAVIQALGVEVREEVIIPGGRASSDFD